MVRANGLLAIAMIAGAGAPIGALELQRNTAEAWQAYLRDTGARMQARLDGGKPFLWVDESPERARAVRRGEVVVAPVIGHGTEPVPNGLIHHWIGAIFIPNATIESLLSVVHDYDRYKDIYKPVVTDSRTLESGAAEQDFSMIWHRHVLFVDAAVQGRYHARDFLIGPRRGYSVVDTTTIQQIEDYGGAGEHLLPPDTGGGFIWRIHSIARFEERAGGLYLEIEAIALTRDVPGSLRWLVNPMMNHLSVNSLSTTLRQTSDAVRGRQVQAGTLAGKRQGLN